MKPRCSGHSGPSCLPTVEQREDLLHGLQLDPFQPLPWLAPWRRYFSSAHAGEPNRETAVTGYKPSLDWSRAWRQRLFLSVGGIFWSQCMRMYCPLQAEQPSVNWVLSRQSASALDVGRIPQTATVHLPTRRKKPKHPKTRNLERQICTPDKWKENNDKNAEWSAGSSEMLLPALEESVLLLQSTKAKQLSPHKLRLARKKVKQLSRRYANRHWQRRCKDIQTASDNGNLRGMYEGIKKAIGPTQCKTVPLKSSIGEVISDKEKQMGRWRGRALHRALLGREPIYNLSITTLYKNKGE